MKGMKKMKNNKFTTKKKNRNILICFSIYLLCSVFAFLSSPWLIGLIGLLSLGLGIATFKKKTVEEIEALEKIKQLQENRNA